VEVPSSGSISGSKSVSCWQSGAYASRAENSVQIREVCEYAYPAGKLWIWELRTPALLLGGTGGVLGSGGVLGRGGIGSEVSCLHQLGGCAADSLSLQHGCGFVAVICCKGRHPSMWF